MKNHQRVKPDPLTRSPRFPEKITKSYRFPKIHRKIQSTYYSALKRHTHTLFHTTGMPNFPTMKTRDLLRILQRRPLSCSIMRTRGSHRTLRTPTGKILRYSHHDAKELSGHQVREVLIDDLGLTEKEALEVLQ